MNEELMTLKEIAQKLGLPESTLRKYRDSYEQYIPSVGSGRNRKYRAEAEMVFKTIRECREERHLSWEDTEKEIKGLVPEDVVSSVREELVKKNEAIDILLEKANEILKNLRRNGEGQEFLISSLGTEIIGVKSEIDVMKRGTVGTREAIHKLDGQLDTIVRYQQEIYRNYKTLKENTSDAVRKIDNLEKKMERGIEGIFAMMRMMEKEKSKEGEKREDLIGGTREEMLKLKEELVASKMELGKYKGLYERMRKDFEEAKERKSMNFDEKLVEPVGGKVDGAALRGKGGTLVVKGVKSK